MNAVGYIRVSTPGQAREGESLRTQEEAIERHAQEHGYTLIEVYRDEGISGAKNNRPALTALLEDAEKKKFEFVIIHRLSRFGRNARDLLNNMEILKNKGIKLLSIKDGIDYSTPYGQAMLTMLAAIAQLERDINDEQMRENKMVKWKEHRTIIGKLPFGYIWDRDKKEILKLEKEAKAYQMMVSMYLDGGKSFHRIASKLNEENIIPRRAKNWSSSVISYILKNPIYYGYYVVNKTKYDGKKRTKEEKPQNEHIIWELSEDLQLISKSRWDLIQAKTKYNKTKGKNVKLTGDYILRDVLVCGECGGVIKPRNGVSRKDGSRLRYYACYWRWTSENELKDKRKKRCILPFINADELEENVWYDLTSYLTLQRLTSGRDKTTPYDDLLDTNKCKDRIRRLNEKVNELENDIKRSERYKERIYELLDGEQFNKNDFIRKLKDISEKLLLLKSKRNEVDDELKNIEQIQQSDQLYKDFLSNRKEFLKNMIRSLHNLSNDEKRILVEGMLIEKIKIYAGDGGEPWEPDRGKLRFNKEILDQLISSGKINILDKDTRHPLREHRLAAPGGAGEKKCMAPGGRDLQRSPRHRLSDHIPEVRPAGGIGNGK